MSNVSSLLSWQWFKIVLGLGVVLLTPSLHAQEPADNQIKAALADIERFEQQFAGQTKVNKNTAARTLKLLTLTRQRLDSSPNKDDASWMSADERYHNLVTFLEQFVAAPQAAPEAPAPATTAAAAAPPTAAAAQMISQDRVRIRKLKRDIDSRFQSMDQAGPKPFQDPDYVAQLEQSAANFRQAIAAYVQFKDDPDVVAAEEALRSFEEMLEVGKGQAARDLAELGDVQARLAAIEAQIQGLQQPTTPEIPFGSGQLREWLVQMATTRQSAYTLSQELPGIRERAYLPNTRLTIGQGGAYDLQDVDRLQHALVNLARSIDDELARFGHYLEGNLAHIRDGLGFYAEMDPADRNDQASHFLSQGRAHEVRAKLAQDLATVGEAASYAELLNDPKAAAWKELAEKVKSTASDYEAKYLKARELVRMPQAASNDSKLRKIAEETLSAYDYIGAIERLVINADKRHLSKETSETEFTDADVSLSGEITLTGTKTTYFYEWDEFQVATAEPVDGAYYIFYNTLRHFTSGAPTTPLNRWILGNRFQGPEIPQENIRKD